MPLGVSTVILIIAQSSLEKTNGYAGNLVVCMYCHFAFRQMLLLITFYSVEVCG